MTRAAGRTIVFSHANGFPAGTYRLLFEAWRAAGWRVLAVERYGHDPRRPVSDNWPHLRDELLALLDAQCGAEAAFLVGHSLGGMLSLMAAAARPALARGVVLLDSPLIAGWRAHSVHMAKLSGLMRRVSPGRIARARRHAWPSRDAVQAHFAAKSAFARWDPRVLEDYVRAGFIERDGELRLAFEREIEARIYDTLPHQIAPLLRRHPLQCPVAYIGGTRSAEARQAGLAATRRLAGTHCFFVTPGTHLFPMEHPDTTAGLVLRMIEGMAPDRATTGHG